MKKLVLSLMLVLSISMLVVSCAKKEEAPATPAVDTTAVKVDTAAVVDTTKKM